MTVQFGTPPPAKLQGRRSRRRRTRFRSSRSLELIRGEPARLPGTKLSLTQETVLKFAANDCGQIARHCAVGLRCGPTDEASGTAAEDVEADAPAGDQRARNSVRLGCDSRKVQPGSLFFALHGAKTDGNAFAKDAVERGAMAIISEERQPADLPEDVAWIRVREARKSLAIAGANFFGHPGRIVEDSRRRPERTARPRRLRSSIRSSRPRARRPDCLGRSRITRRQETIPRRTRRLSRSTLQGFLAEIRDAGGKLRSARSEFSRAVDGSACGDAILPRRFSPT